MHYCECNINKAKYEMSILKEISRDELLGVSSRVAELVQILYEGVLEEDHLPHKCFVN